MTPFAATAAGALGLVLGSLLNVVAFPRSRCRGCAAPVRPSDHVPVLSWLRLRGRCRACQARISARYPVVEAGTALLSGAVVAVKGADRDVWLALALLLLLVPITLIDLDRRIISNRLTGPGSVLALALGAVTEPGQVPEQLIAGAAAGGFLLVAALASPSGMGMGDVKLAGMLGLFLGRGVAVAVLVALIAGTLVGVVIVACKGTRAGRKTAVPFGPFLALGGVVAMFAGGPLVGWYLHAFV